MQIIGLAVLERDAIVGETADKRPKASLPLVFFHGRRGENGQRQYQRVLATLFGERVNKLSHHLLKGVEISVSMVNPYIDTYYDPPKLVARIQTIQLVGQEEVF